MERKGLLEQMKKKESGWFSGWWGGAGKEDETAKHDISKFFSLS